MNDKIKNKFFSIARLGIYKDFCEYEQNLKYSKQFYIPLAILEVSLRNSINTYLQNEISKEWINDKFLHPDSTKRINEVKKRLSLNHKILDNNQIISELSFGFWTSLFRKSYSKTMRTHAIKNIFPNIPKKSIKLITRDYINQKLNHIRYFRNSVFHYDKVINKPLYANINNDIDEILRYFDDEICDFVYILNDK